MNGDAEVSLHASASPIHIVGAGIDTLHCTFRGRLCPKRRAGFIAARQAAEAGGGAVDVVVGGRTLKVGQGGARMWHVLAGDQDLDVAVGPYDGMPVPEVRIRHRSGALWSAGPARVVNMGRAIADELFLLPHDEETGEVFGEPWSEHVSRIDLAVDFQSAPGGWVPDLRRDDGRLLTRAARKAFHVEAVFHKHHKRFTGWSIGSGKPLRVRLYLKTEEIKKSGKSWFKEVWARSAARTGVPYDPAAPVWRFEAQVRRDLLIELRTGQPSERLDDADAVLGNLGVIWSYVTERWVRLAVPNDDGNRARWPTDPAWTVLQRVAHFAHDGVVSRERVRQGALDTLVRQMLPLLAHAAAIATDEEVPSASSAVRWLTPDIERELSRRQLEFSDLVTRHQPGRPARVIDPLQTQDS